MHCFSNAKPQSHSHSYNSQVHFITLYTFITVWQYSVIWCLLSSSTPQLPCIYHLYVNFFHPKHMSIFSTIYFVRFLEAGFLKLEAIVVLLCGVFCQIKHFVVCVTNLGSLQRYEQTFLFTCMGLFHSGRCGLALWGRKQRRSNTSDVIYINT